MVKKRSLAKSATPVTRTTPEKLLAELRDLIHEARRQTAQAVNAALTITYWRVGDRIRREILKLKRAEYGEQILQALSAKLEMEFGRGFAEKNLRRMIQFAEVFPDQQIVVA